MLALIFYKPAAAAVYATAFILIGNGKGVRAILMGFAMVGMSLLALPVLMRFFTWTTGAVADSAAGGGFLQTALSGAVAVGALRGSSGGSGGSGAAEQARLVSDQLGPAGGGPSGAQAPHAGARQAAAAPTPGSGTPGTSAMPPGAGAASSGARAGTAPGAAASGAAAGGTGAAAAAGASAAAAGGPAGAAAGLAAGARNTGRKATEAMPPPRGPEGSQQ
jgi:hypothetical protein